MAQIKKILISIGAFICAAAVFSGTIVYSANAISVLDGSSSSPEIQDNFFQKDDFYIADLLNSSSYSSDINSNLSSINISSNLSSHEIYSGSSLSNQNSSNKYSSKQNSSNKADSSKASSSKSSGKPISSKPTSSKPPPSSSTPSSQDPELLDMVAGAVQREIVGTNTTPSPKYYQAYKAQAVACHSYMKYHRTSTGSFPSMSYSAPHPKTLELVAEVLNELMYYNGSVINASYHAASGGHTQSASYVWGTSVPYLQGVTSKYDDYNSSSTVSVDMVRQQLESYGISTNGDPSTWFDLSGASYTDGGFVDYIPICGQSVKGRTLRETILGTSVLKSPKIVDIAQSGDNFIFYTKGYGHGTGMSQQGALGYSANEGWDYRSILTHYYTGIEIR